MGVGFEKIAILKRAGLALIGIDREQPRRWLLQDQAPLAPGRKPGAAESAQSGMLEDLDQFLRLAFSGETGV